MFHFVKRIYRVSKKIQGIFLIDNCKSEWETELKQTQKVL